MQYVSADVARQIEQSVEIVRNGPDYAKAPALDYIREHAPRDVQEGDEVIKLVGGFFGSEGTIGNVRSIHGGCILIDFPHDKATSWSRNGIAEKLRRISNLVAPAQPETAQPEAGKAVRLYCVESFAGWLTRGNVYDFTPEKEIIFDKRTHCDYDNYQEFATRNPSFSACLVPLVQRPAKVGEWVLVTGGCHDYEINKIYKVFNTGDDVCVWFADDFKGNVRQRDYLVLDGYAGPEAKSAAPDADRIARLEQELKKARAEATDWMQRCLDERRQAFEMKSKIRVLCGKE